ncbi:SRPBCC family protein [Glaciihabitans tibetensis]|nr:SRPBCC family protein [Glaciihabitans tibetensis]
MNEWMSRPPLAVFDFIAAPQNALKVVQSVQSMVKITDGPIGVGTRFRETRLMKGPLKNDREQQAELEVVAYEPGEKYAVKNVTEGIETVYEYTFVPEANGTRVELDCVVTASGAKRMMLPLVVAVLKKEDGDHLERLKRVVEAS